MANIANPFDLRPKKKLKVILVKEALTELQLMLDDGWLLASALPHAKGALLILAKE